MARIVEIEPLVKTFLESNGIVDPIFLQGFGRDGANQAIAVRRDGTGELPDNLPIDVPIVEIVARAAHPQTSFGMQKAIGDLIQGLDTTTVGSVQFLNGKLISGVDRVDIEDLRLFAHVASYQIRVLLS